MKVKKILYKNTLYLLFALFSKKTIASLVCISLVVTSVPADAIAQHFLAPPGVNEIKKEITFDQTVVAPPKKNGSVKLAVDALKTQKVPEISRHQRELDGSITIRSQENLAEYRSDLRLALRRHLQTLGETKLIDLLDNPRAQEEVDAVIQPHIDTFAEADRKAVLESIARQLADVSKNYTVWASAKRTAESLFKSTKSYTKNLISQNVDIFKASIIPSVKTGVGALFSWLSTAVKISYSFTLGQLKNPWVNIVVVLIGCVLGLPVLGYAATFVNIMRGDTLSQIVAKLCSENGIPATSANIKKFVSDIVTLNGLHSPNRIIAGKKLILPEELTGAVKYTELAQVPVETQPAVPLGPSEIESGPVQLRTQPEEMASFHETPPHPEYHVPPEEAGLLDTINPWASDPYGLGIIARVLALAGMILLLKKQQPDSAAISGKLPSQLLKTFLRSYGVMLIVVLALFAINPIIAVPPIAAKFIMIGFVITPRIKGLLKKQPAVKTEEEGVEQPEESPEKPEIKEVPAAKPPVPEKPLPEAAPVTPPAKPEQELPKSVEKPKPAEKGAVVVAKAPKEEKEIPSEKEEDIFVTHPGKQILLKPELTYADFKELQKFVEIGDITLEDVLVALKRIFEKKKKFNVFDYQTESCKILVNGDVLELPCGGGKTVVGVLAAIWMALEGGGVHIITQNDQLVKDIYQSEDKLHEIYNAFGMSVGFVLSAADIERYKQKAKSISNGEQLKVVLTDIFKKSLFVPDRLKSEFDRFVDKEVTDIINSIRAAAKKDRSVIHVAKEIAIEAAVKKAKRIVYGRETWGNNYENSALYADINTCVFDWERNNTAKSTKDLVYKNARWGLFDEDDDIKVNKMRDPFIISTSKGGSKDKNAKLLDAMKPNVDLVIKKQIDVASKYISEVQEMMDSGKYKEGTGWGSLWRWYQNKDIYIKLYLAKQALPGAESNTAEAEKVNELANQMNVEFGWIENKLGIDRKRKLEDNLLYWVDHKKFEVNLTKAGEELFHDTIGVPLKTDQETELLDLLKTFLLADTMFHQGSHYEIKNGKIEIIDKDGGRIQPGRKYQNWIHECLERMEGLNPSEESGQTEYRSNIYAFITNNYKNYPGMTGTAQALTEFYKKIYGQEVVKAPIEKSEEIENKKVYDIQYVVCDTIKEKLGDISSDAEAKHDAGTATLIFADTSNEVEDIEKYLKSKLNEAEQAYIQRIDSKEDENEDKKREKAGKKGAITIVNYMAGRGMDIKPDPIKVGQTEEEVKMHIIISGLPSSSQKLEQAINRIYRLYINPETKKPRWRLGTVTIVLSKEDPLLKHFGETPGQAGEMLRNYIAGKIDKSLSGEMLSAYNQDKVSKVKEDVPGFLKEQAQIASHFAAQKKLEEENLKTAEELHKFDEKVNTGTNDMSAERMAVLEGTGLSDSLKTVMEGAAEDINKKIMRKSLLEPFESFIKESVDFSENTTMSEQEKIRHDQLKMIDDLIQSRLNTSFAWATGDKEDDLAVKKSQIVQVSFLLKDIINILMKENLIAIPSKKPLVKFIANDIKREIALLERESKRGTPLKQNDQETVQRLYNMIEQSLTQLIDTNKIKLTEKGVNNNLGKNIQDMHAAREILFVKQEINRIINQAVSDALVKNIEKHIIQNHYFTPDEIELDNYNLAVSDVLKLNTKSNRILLKALGLKSNELQNVTPAQMAAAFNKILVMKDFYTYIDVDIFKNINPKIKQLLDIAMSEKLSKEELKLRGISSRSLNAEELQRLNRGLLQAVYPAFTEKSLIMDVVQNNIDDEKLFMEIVDNPNIAFSHIQDKLSDNAIDAVMKSTLMDVSQELRKQQRDAITYEDTYFVQLIEKLISSKQFERLGEVSLEKQPVIETLSKNISNAIEKWKSGDPYLPVGIRQRGLFIPRNIPFSGISGPVGRVSTRLEQEVAVLNSRIPAANSAAMNEIDGLILKKEYLQYILDAVKSNKLNTKDRSHLLKALDSWMQEDWLAEAESKRQAINATTPKGKKPADIYNAEMAEIYIKRWETIRAYLAAGFVIVPPEAEGSSDALDREDVDPVVLALESNKDEFAAALDAFAPPGKKLSVEKSKKEKFLKAAGYILPFIGANVVAGIVTTAGRTEDVPAAITSTAVQNLRIEYDKLKDLEKSGEISKQQKEDLKVIEKKKTALEKMLNLYQLSMQKNELRKKITEWWNGNSDYKAYENQNAELGKINKKIETLRTQLTEGNKSFVKDFAVKKLEEIEAEVQKLLEIRLSLYENIKQRNDLEKKFVESLSGEQRLDIEAHLLERDHLDLGSEYLYIEIENTIIEFQIAKNELKQQEANKKDSYEQPLKVYRKIKNLLAEHKSHLVKVIRAIEKPMEIIALKDMLDKPEELLVKDELYSIVEYLVKSNNASKEVKTTMKSINALKDAKNVAGLLEFARKQYLEEQEKILTQQVQDNIRALRDLGRLNDGIKYDKKNRAYITAEDFKTLINLVITTYEKNSGSDRKDIQLSLENLILETVIYTNEKFLADEKLLAELNEETKDIEVIDEVIQQKREIEALKDKLKIVEKDQKTLAQETTEADEKASRVVDKRVYENRRDDLTKTIEIDTEGYELERLEIEKERCTHELARIKALSEIDDLQQEIKKIDKEIERLLKIDSAESKADAQKQKDKKKELVEQQREKQAIVREKSEVLDILAMKLDKVWVLELKQSNYKPDSKYLSYRDVKLLQFATYLIKFNWQTLNDKDMESVKDAIRILKDKYQIEDAKSENTLESEPYTKLLGDAEACLARQIKIEESKLEDSTILRDLAKLKGSVDEIMSGIEKEHSKNKVKIDDKFIQSSRWKKLDADSQEQIMRAKKAIEELARISDLIILSQRIDTLLKQAKSQKDNAVVMQVISLLKQAADLKVLDWSALSGSDIDTRDGCIKLAEQLQKMAQEKLTVGQMRKRLLALQRELPELYKVLGITLPKSAVGELMNKTSENITKALAQLDEMQEENEKLYKLRKDILPQTEDQITYSSEIEKLRKLLLFEKSKEKEKSLFTQLTKDIAKFLNIQHKRDKEYENSIADYKNEHQDYEIKAHENQREIALLEGKINAEPGNTDESKKLLEQYKYRMKQLAIEKKEYYYLMRINDLYVENIQKQKVLDKLDEQRLISRDQEVIKAMTAYEIEINDLSIEKYQIQIELDKIEKELNTKLFEYAQEQNVEERKAIGQAIYNLELKKIEKEAELENKENLIRIQRLKMGEEKDHMTLDVALALSDDSNEQVKQLKILLAKYWKILEIDENQLKSIKEKPETFDKPLKELLIALQKKYNLPQNRHGGWDGNWDKTTRDAVFGSIDRKIQRDIDELQSKIDGSGKQVEIKQALFKYELEDRMLQEKIDNYKNEKESAPRSRRKMLDGINAIIKILQSVNRKKLEKGKIDMDGIAFETQRAKEQTLVINSKEQELLQLELEIARLEFIELGSALKDNDSVEKLLKDIELEVSPDELDKRYRDKKIKELKAQHQEAEELIAMWKKLFNLEETKLWLEGLPMEVSFEWEIDLNEKLMERARILYWIQLKKLQKIDEKAKGWETGSSKTLKELESDLALVEADINISKAEIEVEKKKQEISKHKAGSEGYTIAEIELKKAELNVQRAKLVKGKLTATDKQKAEIDVRSKAIDKNESWLLQLENVITVLYKMHNSNMRPFYEVTKRFTRLSSKEVDSLLTFFRSLDYLGKDSFTPTTPWLKKSLADFINMNAADQAKQKIRLEKIIKIIVAEENIKNNKDPNRAVYLNLVLEIALDEWELLEAYEKLDPNAVNEQTAQLHHDISTIEKRIARNEMLRDKADGKLSGLLGKAGTQAPKGAFPGLADYFVKNNENKLEYEKYDYVEKCRTHIKSNDTLSYNDLERIVGNRKDLIPELIRNVLKVEPETVDALMYLFEIMHSDEAKDLDLRVFINKSDIIKHIDDLFAEKGKHKLKEDVIKKFALNLIGMEQNTRAVYTKEQTIKLTDDMGNMLKDIFNMLQQVNKHPGFVNPEDRERYSKLISAWQNFVKASKNIVSEGDANHPINLLKPQLWLGLIDEKAGQDGITANLAFQITGEQFQKLKEKNIKHEVVEAYSTAFLNFSKELFSVGKQYAAVYMKLMLSEYNAKAVEQELNDIDRDLNKTKDKDSRFKLKIKRSEILFELARAKSQLKKVQHEYQLYARLPESVLPRTMEDAKDLETLRAVMEQKSKELVTIITKHSKYQRPDITRYKEDVPAVKQDFWYHFGLYFDMGVDIADLQNFSADYMNMIKINARLWSPSDDAANEVKQNELKEYKEKCRAMAKALQKAIDQNKSLSNDAWINGRFNEYIEFLLNQTEAEWLLEVYNTRKQGVENQQVQQKDSGGFLNGVKTFFSNIFTSEKPKLPAVPKTTAPPGIIPERAKPKPAKKGVSVSKLMEAQTQKEAGIAKKIADHLDKLNPANTLDAIIDRGKLVLNGLPKELSPNQRKALFEKLDVESRLYDLIVHHKDTRSKEIREAWVWIIDVIDAVPDSFIEDFEGMLNKLDRQDVKTVISEIVKAYNVKLARQARWAQSKKELDLVSEKLAKLNAMISRITSKINQIKSIKQDKSIQKSVQNVSDGINTRQAQLNKAKQLFYDSKTAFAKIVEDNKNTANVTDSMDTIDAARDLMLKKFTNCAEQFENKDKSEIRDEIMSLCEARDKIYNFRSNMRKEFNEKYYGWMSEMFLHKDLRAGWWTRKIMPGKAKEILQENLNKHYASIKNDMNNGVNKYKKYFDTNSAKREFDKEVAKLQIMIVSRMGMDLSTRAENKTGYLRAPPLESLDPEVASLITTAWKEDIEIKLNKLRNEKSEYALKMMLNEKHIDAGLAIAMFYLSYYSSSDSRSPEKLQVQKKIIEMQEILTNIIRTTLAMKTADAYYAYLKALEEGTVKVKKGAEPALEAYWRLPESVRNSLKKGKLPFRNAYSETEHKKVFDRNGILAAHLTDLYKQYLTASVSLQEFKTRALEKDSEEFKFILYIVPELTSFLIVNAVSNGVFWLSKLVFDSGPSPQQAQAAQKQYELAAEILVDYLDDLKKENRVEKPGGQQKMQSESAVSAEYYWGPQGLVYVEQSRRDDGTYVIRTKEDRFQDEISVELLRKESPFQTMEVTASDGNINLLFAGDVHLQNTKVDYEGLTSSDPNKFDKALDNLLNIKAQVSVSGFDTFGKDKDTYSDDTDKPKTSFKVNVEYQNKKLIDGVEISVPIVVAVDEQNQGSYFIGTGINTDSGFEIRNGLEIDKKGKPTFWMNGVKGFELNKEFTGELRIGFTAGDYLNANGFLLQKVGDKFIIELESNYDSEQQEHDLSASGKYKRGSSYFGMGFTQKKGGDIVPAVSWEMKNPVDGVRTINFVTKFEKEGPEIDVAAQSIIAALFGLGVSARVQPGENSQNEYNIKLQRQMAGGRQGVSAGVSLQGAETTVKLGVIKDRNEIGASFGGQNAFTSAHKIWINGLLTGIIKIDVDETSRRLKFGVLSGAGYTQHITNLPLGNDVYGGSMGGSHLILENISNAEKQPPPPPSKSDLTSKRSEQAPGASPSNAGNRLVAAILNNAGKIFPNTAPGTKTSGEQQPSTPSENDVASQQSGTMVASNERTDAAPGAFSRNAKKLVETVLASRVVGWLLPNSAIAGSEKPPLTESVPGALPAESEDLQKNINNASNIISRLDQLSSSTLLASERGIFELAQKMHEQLQQNMDKLNNLSVEYKDFKANNSIEKLTALEKRALNEREVEAARASAALLDETLAKADVKISEINTLLKEAEVTFESYIKANQDLRAGIGKDIENLYNRLSEKGKEISKLIEQMQAAYNEFMQAYNNAIEKVNELESKYDNMVSAIERSRSSAITKLRNLLGSVEQESKSLSGKFIQVEQKRSAAVAGTDKIERKLQKHEQDAIRQAAAKIGIADKSEFLFDCIDSEIFSYNEIIKLLGQWNTLINETKLVKYLNPAPGAKIDPFDGNTRDELLWWAVALEKDKTWTEKEIEYGARLRGPIDAYVISILGDTQGFNPFNSKHTMILKYFTTLASAGGLAITDVESLLSTITLYSDKLKDLIGKNRDFNNPYGQPTLSLLYWAVDINNWVNNRDVNSVKETLVYLTVLKEIDGVGDEILDPYSAKSRNLKEKAASEKLSPIASGGLLKKGFMKEFADVFNAQSEGSEMLKVYGAVSQVQLGGDVDAALFISKVKETAAIIKSIPGAEKKLFGGAIDMKNMSHIKLLQTFAHLLIGGDFDKLLVEYIVRLIEPLEIFIGYRASNMNLDLFVEKHRDSLYHWAAVAYILTKNNLNGLARVTQLLTEAGDPQIKNSLEELTGDRWDADNFLAVRVTDKTFLTFHMMLVLNGTYQKGDFTKYVVKLNAIDKLLKPAFSDADKNRVSDERYHKYLFKWANLPNGEDYARSIQEIILNGQIVKKLFNGKDFTLDDIDTKRLALVESLALLKETLGEELKQKNWDYLSLIDYLEELSKKADWSWIQDRFTPSIIKEGELDLLIHFAKKAVTYKIEEVIKIFDYLVQNKADIAALYNIALPDYDSGTTNPSVYDAMFDAAARFYKQYDASDLRLAVQVKAKLIKLYNIDASNAFTLIDRTSRDLVMGYVDIEGLNGFDALKSLDAQLELAEVYKTAVLNNVPLTLDDLQGPKGMFLEFLAYIKLNGEGKFAEDGYIKKVVENIGDFIKDPECWNWFDASMKDLNNEQFRMHLIFFGMHAVESGDPNKTKEILKAMSAEKAYLDENNKLVGGKKLEPVINMRDFMLLYKDAVSNVYSGLTATEQREKLEIANAIFADVAVIAGKSQEVELSLNDPDARRFLLSFVEMEQEQEGITGVVAGIIEPITTHILKVGKVDIKKAPEEQQAIKIAKHFAQIMEEKNLSMDQLKQMIESAGTIMGIANKVAGSAKKPSRATRSIQGFRTTSAEPESATMGSPDAAFDINSDADMKMLAEIAAEVVTQNAVIQSDEQIVIDMLLADQSFLNVFISPEDYTNFYFYIWLNMEARTILAGYPDATTPEAKATAYLVEVHQIEDIMNDPNYGELTKLHGYNFPPKLAPLPTPERDVNMDDIMKLLFNYAEMIGTGMYNGFILNYRLDDINQIPVQRFANAADLLKEIKIQNEVVEMMWNKTVNGESLLGVSFGDRFTGAFDHTNVLHLALTSMLAESVGNTSIKRLNIHTGVEEPINVDTPITINDVYTQLERKTLLKSKGVDALIDSLYPTLAGVPVSDNDLSKFRRGIYDTLVSDKQITNLDTLALVDKAFDADAVILNLTNQVAIREAGG
ncbi:MAG: hypothetical protein ABII27_03560, partial [bacterium]